MANGRCDFLDFVGACLRRLAAGSGSPMSCGSGAGFGSLVAAGVQASAWAGLAAAGFVDFFLMKAAAVFTMCFFSGSLWTASSMILTASGAGAGAGAGARGFTDCANLDFPTGIFLRLGGGGSSGGGALAFPRPTSGPYRFEGLGAAMGFGFVTRAGTALCFTAATTASADAPARMGLRERSPRRGLVGSGAAWASALLVARFAASATAFHPLSILLERPRSDGRAAGVAGGGGGGGGTRCAPLSGLRERPRPEAIGV